MKRFGKIILSSTLMTLMLLVAIMPISTLVYADQNDNAEITDYATEIDKLDANKGENQEFSKDSLTYVLSVFSQAEMLDLIRQYKSSFSDSDAYKMLRENIENVYREVVANQFSKEQARNLLIATANLETGKKDETEMTFTAQIPDWAPSHQPSTVKQPGAQVNITIPDFAVTINGAAMEKYYSKYPVFVYDGITYFPMTYDGCRFLGLETEWSQQKGLTINKTNISLPLKTYSVSQKNATHYTATVPAFNVIVNGQKVDNKNAEYPLLLFRNVTYFPLTWQYGVESFGWDYYFDNQRGLVIKSQNAVPEITNLIDYNATSDFIVNGNTIYYSGNQGLVYQTSLDNLTQNKIIYQLPKDTAWGENGYVKPYFNRHDGLVSFSYSQTGSNSMTYQVDINPDGTTTEPQAIGPSIAPEVSADGYLLYKFGERVFETEAYRYMITSNTNLADDAQRIYKLNKNTQQITRLTEKVAESFKYRNQKLYFVSDDKKLYSLSLSDESVVLESDGPILGDNYEIVADSIYYVNDTNQKLYQSGKAQPLNWGETVESIELKGDYIVAKYNATLDRSYRTVVYNKSGNAVFILPRQISIVSADSNRIIYYDLVDNQVFMARIK